MDVWVGFDVGGTKCAVSVGILRSDMPEIMGRREIPTPAAQEEALEKMCAMARAMAGDNPILGVGISTGGPLDAARGVLRNPPNLPGWSDVSWTEYISSRLNTRARMENDANACALAEWRWGAGRGCKSMAFLTFGTGLGAGLILDGRLYRGATGSAGELGHWRLSEYGPTGYGKVGSFEGFCSGGGIRQLAQTLINRDTQRGVRVNLSQDDLSARTVAQAALNQDPLAQEVFRQSARQLGKGLALLVDLLNLERIVIGSVYARCEKLMREEMMRSLCEEALGEAVDACRVLPAQLGDSIGDYAALAIASSGGEAI